MIYVYRCLSAHLCKCLTCVFSAPALSKNQKTCHWTEFAHSRDSGSLLPPKSGCEDCGSLWHTGRSWLSAKTQRFSQTRLLVFPLALSPYSIDFAERQIWKNDGESDGWCQIGGAVTCGFVHKWKSKNECETYLRWKCQSTDPVFFTLETLCLCTRKARWMASSVLWGTFLLSISISNHSRVHGLTLPYARLKTAFTLHQAWTSSNVCFMQIQQVKT